MKNIKINYFKLPLLTLFSYTTVFISIVSTVLFTLYLFYLLAKPCEIELPCGVPPVFFIYLIIAAIVLILNIIGVIAGFFARDQRTFKLRPYVQWNLKIIYVCLIYLLFGVMVSMS